MEQALTVNMWDIERFEKEYFEFLATFDRLTDGLEWLIPQTPGWYMPRLEGAPEKPRDMLPRFEGMGFDSALAVASLKKAEKFASEVYYNIPRHEWGDAARRWGWLNGELCRFNYRWRIE